VARATITSLKDSSNPRIWKPETHELIQKYGDLAEQSIRQKEILDRLIGYSLTNESDHLNLEEKLRALEARMKRLENQN